MANPNGKVTKNQLIDLALDAMEDDLKITKKQAKDFVESAHAAVMEQLEKGMDIVVFDFANLKPDFVLKRPKRMAANPRTGEVEEQAARPEKVRIKVTANKRMKDAVPAASTKVAKVLKAITVERAEAAAKRKADKEAEAEKQARKDAKEAAAAEKAKNTGKKSGDKSSGKKSGGGKKAGGKKGGKK